MKKILVTGGTGFIGEKVVELLSKNNLVFVLTRNHDFKDSKNVKYIYGDICNEQKIKEIVIGKDIIIHMSGSIKGSDEEIFKTNIVGTENLINACKNINIENFVFISSDAVFQKHRSGYSESKVKGEEIIKKIKNHCILRPAIVYGEGDKINLGKIINFVKKWPVIIIPGNGNNKMQPICVEDVAKYISIAATSNIQGVYTLAGSDILTFNTFMDEACLVLNKKLIKIHLPLFFIIPFVWLVEKLFPNLGVSISQVKNLNSDRVYDISETIKTFKHEPIKIKEGLKRTIVH